MDTYISTTKSSPDCPAQIKLSLDYVDNAFKNKDTKKQEFDEVMTIFGGTGVRPDEFMYYLADIWSDKVQYGQRTDLCTFVATLKDMDIIDQLKEWRKLADIRNLNA